MQVTMWWHLRRHRRKEWRRRRRHGVSSASRSTARSESGPLANATSPGRRPSGSAVTTSSGSGNEQDAIKQSACSAKCGQKLISAQPHLALQALCLIAPCSLPLPLRAATALPVGLLPGDITVANGPLSDRAVLREALLTPCRRRLRHSLRRWRRKCHHIVTCIDPVTPSRSRLRWKCSPSRYRIFHESSVAAATTSVSCRRIRDIEV